MAEPEFAAIFCGEKAACPPHGWPKRSYTNSRQGRTQSHFPPLAFSASNRRAFATQFEEKKIMIYYYSTYEELSESPLSPTDAKCKKEQVCLQNNWLAERFARANPCFQIKLDLCLTLQGRCGRASLRNEKIPTVVVSGC